MTSSVARSQTFYVRFGKRLVDLTLGVPLAVLAAPLVVVIAAMSALVFRANPFFVQRRIGWRGRPLAFPKLRSLPVHTPTSLGKYELARVRTPRFGSFIRRWHLDELPQVFLVPFGRMSLVGPRPEMFELAGRYDREFADLRQSVRPGCTGLWQVGNANACMIYEAPEFDTTYVERASFVLDLWVLWRTAILWLSRSRSLVKLSDLPGKASATPAVAAPRAPASSVAMQPMVVEPAVLEDASRH